MVNGKTISESLSGSSLPSGQTVVERYRTIIKELGGNPAGIMTISDAVRKIRELSGNGSGTDAEVFYIFHSSDATLEAVTMPTNVTQYDFTKKVRPGCFYGGIATQYGGVQESDIETAKNTAITMMGHSVAVANAEVYTGSSLTTKSGANFWVRANLLRSSYVLSKDAVYYLREIPDRYRAIYAELGINGDQRSITFIAPLIDTFFIAAYIEVSNHSHQSVISNSYMSFGKTITASDIANVKRGYIFANYCDTADSTNSICNPVTEFGSNDFTVEASVKTADGVIVPIASHTYNGGDWSSADSLKIIHEW